jgi:hypothetical protein
LRSDGRRKGDNNDPPTSIADDQAQNTS